MRTRLVQCIATTICIVAASCSFPNSSSSSCDSDPAQCPQSSRAATSVTCDCRCTIGISEDTGDNFDGRVAVCLPAPLNAFSGSDVQKTALHLLDGHAFDQRVFQYCSKEVATFLRTAIKAPVGLRACAVPVHCSCSTKGAQLDSDKCHTECPEVACDAKNCPGLLRRNSKLDSSTCFCSRADACGVTAPRAEEPKLCHDWSTPTGTLGARIGDAQAD